MKKRHFWDECKKRGSLTRASLKGWIIYALFGNGDAFGGDTVVGLHGDHVDTSSEVGGVDADAFTLDIVVAVNDTKHYGRKSTCTAQQR